jgi:hypothetical protein
MPNTPVTLSAQASAGSIFTGWFGAGCSGTGDCVMDGAGTVTATFQRRHNVVFVTSQPVVPAELGGLSGADGFCQKRADTAGLVGTYVAWLSSSTVDAKDRIAGARGWIRADGRPFADSVDDLVHGRLFYPPSVDEFGQPLAPSGLEMVITGTGADGTSEPAFPAHCDDWSSTNGLYAAGVPFDGPERWTNALSLSCDTAARLYCMGIDDATALVPARVSGRVAFLTSSQHTGAEGVAQFDAGCQLEADANWIPGTFRALIATSTAPAASRFSTNGELWVRLDGIPVTATATQLFNDTSLLAPIALTPLGGYMNVATWSGATTPAGLAAPSANCADWGASTGVGRYGAAASTLPSFFAYGAADCTLAEHITCLEE